MKLFILFFCLLSVNAFATEIYKCIDKNGKQSLSDQPCAKGQIKQQVLVYENREWLKELDSSKPENTIISSIKKSGKATEFIYRFSKDSELKVLMALASKLSGENVYLLTREQKTSKNDNYILVRVKVTPEENLLFGKSSFFKSQETKKIEKHRKYCLPRGAPKHKANFLKDELCTYGENGCDGIEITESFEVLCDQEKVSQCYSEKKWLNRNQYFGLNQKFEIVNINHTIQIKSGKKTEEVCAFYK